MKCLAKIKLKLIDYGKILGVTFCLKKHFNAIQNCTKEK